MSSGTPARARAARRLVAAAAAGLVCAGLLGGCSDASPGQAAPTGSAVPTGAASDPAATAGAEPGAPGGRPEPTVVQTPVAPPAGEGSLAPVPTAAVTTLPPVAVEAPAQVSAGLQVRLAELAAVEVTGRGPGELSGPAVAVTVEVSNSGGTGLAVDGLAVSLGYAGTEAGTVDGPPAAPLVGPVAAGATVRGTYVFLVPVDQREAVTVRVGLASQPVAVFTGSATT